MIPVIAIKNRDTSDFIVFPRFRDFLEQ